MVVAAAASLFHVSDSVISCVLQHRGISLIPNLQVYYLQEQGEGSHSLCELHPLTDLARLNLFIEPHKSHHHNKLITQGENKDDFFYYKVNCFLLCLCSCKMCPVNTFSAPHATECSKCNEVTEYAGMIFICDQYYCLLFSDVQ